MGSTLKIKNQNGEWREVLSLTGKSAFEIAVENGFKGTEKEWLESLEPSQPDWSENDETSSSYIKNRTHYVYWDFDERQCVAEKKIDETIETSLWTYKEEVSSFESTFYPSGYEGEHICASKDVTLGDMRLWEYPYFKVVFNGNEYGVAGETFKDANGEPHLILRFNDVNTRKNVLIDSSYSLFGRTYVDILMFGDGVQPSKPISIVIIPYLSPQGTKFIQLDSRFIPDYVSRTYVDEVTADIRGENTKTIADGSIALGINTIVGRRGYYIKSIDAAAKKIYLAAEKEEIPVFSDADNTDADFSTPGYETGDWISIINGSHYYYCAKVQSIEHNVLTFEGDLGFAAFAKDTAQDGHTLYVPTKPEVGAVTFGVGGFAAGENCKGGGRGVFIGGRDNVGANYASIGGRENQGGYGTGVFGTFNFVPGLGSFGGGNKHEMWGRYCGFTGNQNYIAPGVVESVIEGLSNRIETSHTHGGGRYSKSRNGSLNTFHGESLDIEGSFNDVEGRGCKVRRNFNFVRGDNLIACGNQAVLGAYNIEDPDKLLIIGGGTAKERKNILTIDREGNINGAKLDSMQEELDGMHAKLADMADFVVLEVMEGLTEEISIAPRFSFFGTYFRVLTDGVPIEETYLPIGGALRTAHGALWAENVQIALYDAGKQETMRCRLKLAHEDVNVKYGHLVRE